MYHGYNATFPRATITGSIKVKLLATPAFHSFFVLSLVMQNFCHAADNNPHNLSLAERARLTNFSRFPVTKLQKIQSWEKSMAEKLSLQVNAMPKKDPQREKLEGLRDESYKIAQTIFEKHLSLRYTCLSKEHARKQDFSKAFHYTILLGADTVYQTIDTLLAASYHQHAISLCFQAGQELNDAKFTHYAHQLLNTYRSMIDTPSAHILSSTQEKRLQRRTKQNPY
ncbi:MAG TPA: hypothetical protein VGT41_06015 [Candidatus Babeliales bacterium]|nr:hypothetical protein [Candidatus Babeliales bacterium]